MKGHLFSESIQLNYNNVYLKPLSYAHEQGLVEVTKDGVLWNIRTTSTPHFSEVHDYIEQTLIQKEQGVRYPFVVIEENTGHILGTTSFYDILLNVKRLDIGYTWYAQSVQRTHVNTTCKLLLLEYAFEYLDRSQYCGISYRSI